MSTLILEHETVSKLESMRLENPSEKILGNVFDTYIKRKGYELLTTKDRQYLTISYYYNEIEYETLENVLHYDIRVIKDSRFESLYEISYTQRNSQECSVTIDKNKFLWRKNLANQFLDFAQRYGYELQYTESENFITLKYLFNNDGGYTIKCTGYTIK